MKAGLLGLVVAATLGLAPPVQAIPFTQSLDFFAPTQSLWGPGGSTADFGANGEIDALLFKFGYNIGASSGTVSANFKGNMAVDHPASLSVPGMTTFSLSFLGDAGGGRLRSDLGAWAKVDAGSFSILNKEYALNVDEGNTSQLGQPVSGSDSFTAGNAGVDILVAKAGADFDIEQTSRFKANALYGLLAYSLQGSGATDFMPFSLATNSGLVLDLALDAVGTWDFWLVGMELDNTFSTSFDAELVLYEEHIQGIRICRRCRWGVCVSIPCGINYDRNEFVLADINVYNRAPFALDFNSVSSNGGFSIRVGSETTQVPEPATLALVALGLVGVGWLRRVRQH